MLTCGTTSAPSRPGTLFAGKFGEAQALGDARASQVRLEHTDGAFAEQRRHLITCAIALAQRQPGADGPCQTAVGDGVLGLQRAFKPQGGQLVQTAAELDGFGVVEPPQSVHREAGIGS